jgi:hypothetical protein
VARIGTPFGSVVCILDVRRYLFSTRLQETEPADLASSSTVLPGRVWGKKEKSGELRSPLWLVDSRALQQGTAANL